MQENGGTEAPRHRIERAASGYRVIGPGVLVWEPTLGEAAERREELEGGRVRFPPGSLASEGEPPWPGGVVYGPIRSRRLGVSLGIDLSPAGRRACNFDCVYCQGPPPGADAGRAGGAWPAPAAVAAALSEALRGAPSLDSITFSGHGEPTLHPDFPEVVDDVLAVASRERPGVEVRILSNGSRAVVPAVRAALDRLTERIVKLDAEPQRVSRPAPGAPLGALLHGLGLLRDVTVQSCFVEGDFANTGAASVAEWADLLAELRPRAVQVYTIDRQPLLGGVLPAAAAALEEIACRLRARTAIEAGVFP